MSLWATKSIAALRAEAEAGGDHGLRRTLSASNLVFLGIGAIIGAGIFVLTGVAAALHAGPAVPISMMIVGVACALAGLCYAEMASTVPVAGSAYTYSYATMGELVAWIIGWDLILEYAMGAAGVAVGWSGHFASLLDAFGLHMPAALAQAPFQWCTPANVQAAVAGCVHAGWNSTGAFINLPAMVVSALMTWVLVIGIKESANLNNLIVVLKVLIIVVVVGWGVMHLTRANWTPYVPPNTGVWGEFGWSGVLRGPGWSSLRTSASTRSAPRRRRPRIPSGTFRSASSVPWPSARCSTWWCRRC